MSPLAASLDEYLGLRRSLGYKFERAGELLADFVAFADWAGADHVTVAGAVEWALRAEDTGSSWRAQRLGVVRGFARQIATWFRVDHQRPTHTVEGAALDPSGVCRLRPSSPAGVPSPTTRLPALAAVLAAANATPNPTA